MTTQMNEVARCTKCGRGFVTMPRAWPAFDPFLPIGTPRQLCTEGTPICGGAIVRVPDGVSANTKEG